MDTVASFGNPFNENEVFFQPTLPFTVSQAVHAMAYDLNRRGFGLDRVFGNQVLEVWFRGGHGDIGGNVEVGINKPNRSRTNIVLNFLQKKQWLLVWNSLITMQAPILSISMRHFPCMTTIP